MLMDPSKRIRELLIHDITRKVRLYCTDKDPYQIGFLLSYNKSWIKWEDDEIISTYCWYNIELEHLCENLSEVKHNTFDSKLTEDNPLNIPVRAAYSPVEVGSGRAWMREREERSRVEVSYHQIYLILEEEGIFYRDRKTSRAIAILDLSDKTEELCTFFSKLKHTLFNNYCMDFTKLEEPNSRFRSLRDVYKTLEWGEKRDKYLRPKDAIAYYTMKIRYMYETFLLLRDGPDFIDEIYTDGFLINKKGIKLFLENSDWVAKYTERLHEYYQKSKYIITNEQQCDELIEKITDYVNNSGNKPCK